MQQQLQVSKWHIMKNSKDVESKKVYQYRLNLDRKGHIGQGRKTSPCLELEFVERSKALDLTTGTRYGGQGLGFRPQAERKLTPREELIALMKKEAERKRLVDAKFMACLGSRQYDEAGSLMAIFAASMFRKIP